MPDLSRSRSEAPAPDSQSTMFQQTSLVRRQFEDATPPCRRRRIKPLPSPLYRVARPERNRLTLQMRSVQFRARPPVPSNAFTVLRVLRLESPLRFVASSVRRERKLRRGKEREREIRIARIFIPGSLIRRGRSARGFNRNSRRCVATVWRRNKMTCLRNDISFLRLREPDNASDYRVIKIHRVTKAPNWF